MDCKLSITNVILKNSRRWLLCCLPFFISNCNNHKTPSTTTINQESIEQERLFKKAFNSIDSAITIVKPGDLIVRTGNDFTSESLRNLHQRDKTYSHCGIANIENNTVYVYHALGGEFNPDQKIIREPLKKFADPHNNRGIGIYRSHISPSDMFNCIQIVKQLYKNEVMFDMDFDLKSDDRMYCAEFVYKAYSLGTSNKLKFNISRIKNFEFIGVDDIFLHPLFTLEKKILYK